MDEAFIKKVQPNSPEAEQSVIGAMIMDRDAIADVIDIVNADDFYQKQNGILFEAMTELYREGKPVDLVTLQNKLKKKVSTLQERGKALEIKFAKQCFLIYTGGKSNDYKKVSINYQSWLYPLEGEDAKYFIPLPNRECTYEKLGDAKELLEYLEKCIE